MDIKSIELLEQALKPKLTKYMVLKPTPKQTAFLLMNNVKEILYGGAAGGGKSVAQLMAALQYVDVPGYSAILFRKTFADLSLPGALMDMSKSWLSPWLKTGEVKWKDKEKVYIFPSGATVSFGYLENENDKHRYQGAEFHYIGMDECTHISPGNYTYLFSRLRRTKDLDVPLRFRATANPGGVYGDYYYERFFVEGKEKGRVFISAGITDNPHLDHEAYIEALDELDPIDRERLLMGNWEIKASGDLFSRDWFAEVNILDIPTNAKKVRYWDLASTDPSRRKNKTKLKAPDWSVGFKLNYYQGMYWIEDIIRVQKTPGDLENIIRNTAISDGRSCLVRMEQEPGSSGAIATDHYKRNVLPEFNFDGISSTGSKVERARNASAASQAGKVLIIDRCRNKKAFYDEIDTFPNGVHDDVIDGFSGAFNTFKTRPSIIHIPSTNSKSNGSYWGRFSLYDEEVR